MAEGQGGRPFKRRRPPSRQATRLMLLSAVAAIGLGVVLGAIFIPILLKHEETPPSPRYDMAVFPQGTQLRFEIIGALFPGQLGDFDVLLQVDGENHTFGPLPEGLPGLVTFVDGNADGILNVGDHFLVALEEGRTYVLLIRTLERTGEAGVGFARWPPL